MRIYLSSEIASRELASNLFLAKKAANRGHEAWIVEDLSFRWMARLGVFRPGVFHAKSINPRREKEAFHSFLLKKSFVLTSLDQEAGIQIEDIDNFVKLRFAPEDVTQRFSRIFCWGNHDYAGLRRAFPDQKKNFVISGSPRVDLWRRSARLPVSPLISELQPYALFSSNFNSNRQIPFWRIIEENKPKELNESGKPWVASTQAYIDSFRRELDSLMEFRAAINFLLQNRPDLNIVVRPHPREDVRAWEYLAESHERVRVIRQGDLSTWIANSEFLVHSRCTSSVEAFLMGAKSYSVTSRSENLREPDFFDSLSEPFPWPASHSDTQGRPESFGGRSLVSERIFVPNGQTSSEVIIDEWEKIWPNRKDKESKANYFFIWVASTIRAIAINLRNFHRRVKRAQIYSAKFNYSAREIRELAEHIQVEEENEEGTPALEITVFSKQVIRVTARTPNKVQQSGPQVKRVRPGRD